MICSPTHTQIFRSSVSARNDREVSSITKYLQNIPTKVSVRRNAYDHNMLIVDFESASARDEFQQKFGNIAPMAKAA